MTVVVLAQTNLKPIPPPGYGGIERMIDCLCRGLSDHGTEVLLIANKDARTAAKQIDLPITIPTSRAGRVENILRLGTLLRRLNRQSSILHSFLDIPYWFPLHAFWKGRVVCTFSTPISPKHIRAFVALRRSNAVLCGVSDAHWRCMPYPELWRTVYNGIDTSLYTLPSGGSARRRGSLLYLGRISPMKGVDIAIDVAEKSGIPLVIAGNLSPGERGGIEYFEAVVRPRLGHHIQWVGEVTDQQKAALFETARALLFPTQCEEPFGLVMAEAMASGVPVIALRKGGVPEIVVDGKTGFVCDTTDQMVGAIEHLADISPSFCRRHVLEHFSERVMVQSYLRLYGDSSN